MVTAAMKLKDACSLGKKSYDQPRQHIKKQRRYFADKCPSSQSYGFFSSHVWIRKLDDKEDWALKNWCFWTVAFEKTLGSPLVSKEIKPVNPKGNQPWIFIEGLMLKLQCLATWCEELTLWKRPWCWDRLKAGERGNRGWDGWTASLTQWTCCCYWVASVMSDSVWPHGL